MKSEVATIIRWPRRLPSTILLP